MIQITSRLSLDKNGIYNSSLHQGKIDRTFAIEINRVAGECVGDIVTSFVIRNAYVRLLIEHV